MGDGTSCCLKLVAAQCWKALILSSATAQGCLCILSTTGGSASSSSSNASPMDSDGAWFFPCRPNSTKEKNMVAHPFLHRMATLVFQKSPMETYPRVIGCRFHGTLFDELPLSLPIRALHCQIGFQCFTLISDSTISAGMLYILVMPH